MIEMNGTTVKAEGPPAPTANEMKMANALLRQVNDIVLDAAEAIHDLAMKHKAAHQVSAHAQALAETLAGSTVDWIRRWPS